VAGVMLLFCGWRRGHARLARHVTPFSVLRNAPARWRALAAALLRCGRAAAKRRTLPPPASGLGACSILPFSPSVSRISAPRHCRAAGNNAPSVLFCRWVLRHSTFSVVSHGLGLVPFLCHLYSGAECMLRCRQGLTCLPHLQRLLPPPAPFTLPVLSPGQSLFWQACVCTSLKVVQPFFAATFFTGGVLPSHGCWRLLGWLDCVPLPAKAALAACAAAPFCLVARTNCATRMGTRAVAGAAETLLPAYPPGCCSGGWNLAGLRYIVRRSRNIKRQTRRTAVSHLSVDAKDAARAGGISHRAHHQY